MIVAPVEILVLGLPAPKGSLKCVGRAGGRHRLVEDNPRTRRWRKIVAAEAEATGARADHWQAIGVNATFFLPRPVSHYRTGRNAALLRGNVPAFPTHFGTGDVDKLLRLILDALQDGNVLHDDAQVVSTLAGKHWETESAPPGVLVRVFPIDPDLEPVMPREVVDAYLPGDAP